MMTDKILQKMAPWLVWGGLLIVFVTHVWIIVQGGLPTEQSILHAQINIVAGVMLLIGGLNMRKR